MEHPNVIPLSANFKTTKVMHTQISSLAVLKWVCAFVVAQWIGIPSAIQTLLILMGLDYLTGVGASLLTSQRVSSQIGFRGLIRKSMVIIMLLVARQLELATGFDGFHMANAIAVAYSCNEFISILENVTKSGVPIPVVAVEFAGRFRKIWRPATQDEISHLRDQEMRPATQAEVDDLNKKQ